MQRRPVLALGTLTLAVLLLSATNADAQEHHAFQTDPSDKTYVVSVSFIDGPRKGQSTQTTLTFNRDSSLHETTDGLSGQGKWYFAGQNENGLTKIHYTFEEKQPSPAGSFVRVSQDATLNATGTAFAAAGNGSFYITPAQQVAVNLSVSSAVQK